MNNQRQDLRTNHKVHTALTVVSKIVTRMIGAGLMLAFGFWLLLASNMGPAYLPHAMDGALDFWIRMTFLGLGLGLWIMTAVWLIWLISRYLYRLFGPNH